jgi:hypothetical protein
MLRAIPETMIALLERRLEGRHSLLGWHFWTGCPPRVRHFKLAIPEAGRAGSPKAARRSYCQIYCQ